MTWNVHVNVKETGHLRLWGKVRRRLISEKLEFPDMPLHYIFIYKAPVLIIYIYIVNHCEQQLPDI